MKYPPTVRAAPALCAAVFLAAASMGGAPAARALETDLGEEGNQAVSDTFTAYKTANPSGACSALGAGKRVIVTGYGLFAGRNYNISGEVVSAMADNDFWPGQYKHFQTARAAKKYVYSPRMNPQAFSNGAIVSTRKMVLNGEDYNVCFMVLDVTWDLAAGILIYETSRFKPEMIMMTGGGAPQATFEGAAVNSASNGEGYKSNGEKNYGNRPESNWLLEDYPAGKEIKTTWNGAALAAATAKTVSYLGYTVSGPAAQSPNNDYLCNNITFLALHATQYELPTKLAGNRTAGYKISLPAPRLPKKPIVGFFHFPDVPSRYPDLAGYGSGIFWWVNVLATAVQTALGTPAQSMSAASPVSTAVQAQPNAADTQALSRIQNSSF
ncbi:MAG: hypothetical protein NTY45_11640 [Elusimicrobia bacterium]|nr:hypothetical protein [Elusimicrobiota bacterium]